MRIASFRSQSATGWGIVDGEQLIICPADGYPSDIQQLLEDEKPAMTVLTALSNDPNTQRTALAELELTSPIPRPRKNIMCLGLNYAAHVQESLSTKGLDVETPEHPVVFTKAVSAVTG